MPMVFAPKWLQWDVNKLKIISASYQAATGGFTNVPAS